MKHLRLPIPIRMGLVIAAIIVKLALVTAMANRNIADFVYAGF